MLLLVVVGIVNDFKRMLIMSYTTGRKERDKVSSGIDSYHGGCKSGLRKA